MYSRQRTASPRFTNLSASFITHKQFPFTQVLPVTYSRHMSPQHEKRMERRLLTEQHKNMKADLSMTDFFSHGSTAPSGPRPPHYTGFTIILRHIHSVGLLCTSDRPVAETSA